MADEYYVLSLKWSVGSDYVVFWGPNDGGYFTNLAEAGRYSQEQIDAHRSYYDNGHTTLAVPCSEIDALAWRTVFADRLHDTILKNHGVDWMKVLEERRCG